MAPADIFDVHICHAFMLLQLVTVDIVDGYCPLLYKFGEGGRRRGAHASLAPHSAALDPLLSTVLLLVTVSHNNLKLLELSS